MQLAANNAYETTHFNLTGIKPNPTIKFTHQPTLLKKLREFLMKNPIIKSFFDGIDKKDERLLMMEMKLQ
jgi:hypothetical protein